MKFNKLAIGTITFGILMVGFSRGCDHVKHNIFAPAREICDYYQNGKTFRPTEFGEMIYKHNITIAHIRAKGKSFSFNVHRDRVAGMVILKEMDQIDEGMATAVISLGFEKFSCSITFYDQKVIGTEVRGWD